MKKILTAMILIPSLSMGKGFEIGASVGVATYSGFEKRNIYPDYKPLLSYSFGLRAIENLGNNWQVGLLIDAFSAKATYRWSAGMGQIQESTLSHLNPAVPICLGVNRKINLPKSYIFIGGAFGLSLNSTGLTSGWKIDENTFTYGGQIGYVYSLTNKIGITFEIPIRKVSQKKLFNGGDFWFIAPMVGIRYSL